MSRTQTQSRVAEVAHKLERVRTLFDQLELDAVLLTRPFLVGWLTAGMDDLILRGSDPGWIWALVTRDQALILTQNVEAPRIEAEEGAAAIGFDLVTFPWHEPREWTGLAADLVHPGRVGNDGHGPGRDISSELQRLRLTLLPSEQERLRALGRASCDVVESALRSLTPGTTEAALAGRVAAGLEERSIYPFALLCGSDERRRAFRHPTVSQRVIGRDVLIVIVGVRGGLNVALTRSASFGPSDPVLQGRHLVACEADARMIGATRPGSTYGEALQAGIDTYERHGYLDEWRHHYQGGTIGYGSREFVPAPLAAPNAYTSFPVEVGHAVAWNPTVQGGKSEDTIIVGEEENELVSNSDTWPSIEVPAGDKGETLLRPAILEL